MGVLLVGSALPAPQNLFAPPEERVQDVTVSVTATWACATACLQGREWRLTTPVVEQDDSRLLNLGSLFRNLAFTSPSRDLAFTLNDAATGVALETLMDRTGRGGLTGGERTARVTFVTVPPGDYVVSASVLHPDGRALVTSTAAVRVPEVS